MQQRDDVLVIQTSTAGIGAFCSATHFDKDTDFHGLHTPTV